MCKEGICWDFPLLGNGNESGSNIAAITMFKGTNEMDGLAREVCQNSLDAKNKDLGESCPVIVQFELSTIRKDDYDIFEGYEEAIKNCREYWDNNPLATDALNDFILSIENALNNDTIPILTMSDYNTKGLNGVNASGDEKSFWNLLVNTEGISIKDDKSSAGSYGFGKNAPFAYSSLNLIFYNTLAIDGGKALEGVTRLATTTREYKGKKRKTQPIGKYLYLIDEFEGRPILESDNCSFSKFHTFLRKPDETGTDVAIIGFKQANDPDWEKLLAIAIIKNFILSLYNKKLEVIIKSEKKEYRISSDSLEKYLYDEFKNEKQLKIPKQIYETIKKYDKKEDFTVADENDLTIYMKYSDDFMQSLSRFRAGMLINTTTKDILPHFSAVVVINAVGNETLSATLKEAEPPQHTEWKAIHIKEDKVLRSNATKYIKKINEYIQDMLDDYDRSFQTETIIDAGTGKCLPDLSAGATRSKSEDGVTCDVHIEKITKDSGEVLYDNTITKGEDSIGKAQEKTPNQKRQKKEEEKKKYDKSSSKGTPKKRVFKNKRKINKIEDEKNKGLDVGENKYKILTPQISDYRIFNIAGDRYRLIVNAEEEYNKFLVEFYAFRDDSSIDTDPLKIKSYKVNDEPVVNNICNKVGPIVIKQATNIIHIEFENNEIMAITPIFTAEVENAK